MIKNGHYVVLDFDGTVVKHRYPIIGEDIGAVPILRKLIQNGHKILLNTMRSHNSEGKDTLQPAIDWFTANEIPLYGVNENPCQQGWTTSPKVYGNIYIDDASLGAPLKKDDSPHPILGAAPPYIDWKIASIYLFYQGFLTEQDIIDLRNQGIINPNLVETKK